MLTESAKLVQRWYNDKTHRSEDSGDAHQSQSIVPLSVATYAGPPRPASPAPRIWLISSDKSYLARMDRRRRPISVGCSVPGRKPPSRYSTGSDGPHRCCVTLCCVYMLHYDFTVFALSKCTFYLLTYWSRLTNKQRLIFLAAKGRIKSSMYTQTHRRNTYKHVETSRMRGVASRAHARTLSASIVQRVAISAGNSPPPVWAIRPIWNTVSLAHASLTLCTADSPSLGSLRRLQQVAKMPTAEGSRRCDAARCQATLDTYYNIGLYTANAWRCVER